MRSQEVKVMTEVQQLNCNKTTYCGSFNSPVHCSVVIPENLKEKSQNSSNFVAEWSEEQQRLLDSYLIRVNPESKYSKTLMEAKTLQSLKGFQQLPNSNIKPPLTEEQKKAIQDKYYKKAKERQNIMYEKALSVAIQREIEEGRKFRSQRTIKFNVHYGTYFGQTLFVVGSSKSLGAWDPKLALPLIWSPGNFWRGSAILSTDDGIVEYKYILKDSTFSALHWEPGFNHKINTKEINSTSILIEDQWGSGSI